MPRTIKKELALFTASDLKIFFNFFSLTVLLDVLPELYWEHHCKIVAAIAMLSQESISNEEILVAENLLHLYVSDFERLYGVRYMSLNMHQLLHLGDVTRNLGPNFVYSCFFFESLNGQLKNLIHGTQHAALQISALAPALMRLPVLVDEMPDCDAKSLCLKFMEKGKKKFKIAEIIDDKTFVLGKYKKCNPVPLYVRQLLRDDLGIVNGRHFYFLRLKKKAQIYCSEMYTRSLKKLSCFVEVFHNEVPILCKIKAFIKWSSCNIDCPERCVNCEKRFICVVALYDRVPWRIHDLGHVAVQHLNKVIPSNRLAAFYVNSIRNVCLYVPVDQEEYMCLPVNTLEIE